MRRPRGSIGWFGARRSLNERASLAKLQPILANAGKVCNGTTSCETDVTVPANAAPGTYVLQVIEWMTPHGSAANNGEWGCFYAHCANVRVMESDATVPDGGVVVLAGGLVLRPPCESGPVP